MDTASSPAALSARALRALAFLPALPALLLVLLFGVDVPWADGWDTPGELLEHAADGRLGITDLFRWHNESRPAFPRLIFAPIAWLVGWHPKLFMVLSWGCVCFTAWGVHRFVATGPTSFGGWALVTAFLINALIFSARQLDNQLFGTAFILFVPAASMIGCLWIASTARSPAAIFLGCAALSLASTFSYANGFLCWVLGCPALFLWLRHRAGLREHPEGSTLGTSLGIWTMIYTLCAVATIVFYYSWDPRKYAPPIGVGVFWNEPVAAFKFLVAWVGAPLAGLGSGTSTAAIVGGVLVLGVLGCLTWLLQEFRRTRDPKLWVVIYPWLVMLGYGLISGLATTTGRTFLGPEAALGGRYSSFALWVPVGLIGLAHALWSRGSATASRPARLAFGAALALAGLLAALSWHTGVTLMPIFRDTQRQNLMTLRFLDRLPNNPLIVRLYPDPVRVRRRASVLHTHGFLAYDPVGPWISQRLQHPEPEEGGTFRVGPMAPGRIRLSGSATLPRVDRVADAVLVCLGERPVERQPITALILKGGDPGARFSNMLRVPRGFRLDRLSLFAVDLREHKLYPLRRDES